MESRALGDGDYGKRASLSEAPYVGSGHGRSGGSYGGIYGALEDASQRDEGGDGWDGRTAPPRDHAAQPRRTSINQLHRRKNAFRATFGSELYTPWIYVEGWVDCSFVVPNSLPDTSMHVKGRRRGRCESVCARCEIGE